MNWLLPQVENCFTAFNQISHYQILIKNFFLNITSNHRQIGVNIVGLLNRFWTSSVKCCTTNFSIHASECPVFIMNQLKSVYNIPFLDSYSHPIHTCLSMIASNVFVAKWVNISIKFLKYLGSQKKGREIGTLWLICHLEEVHETA